MDTSLNSLSVSLVGMIFMVVGCNAPQSSAPAKSSEMPNISQPMQDVRTEAKIQEMEMWYNANKNSQPTHQHEAEAKAAKKAQEAEAAKVEKKDPEGKS